MAIILKHKKILKIQRQKVHYSEWVQTASIQKKIRQNLCTKSYMANKMTNSTHYSLRKNGRKNPFNTLEVKYFEV